MPDWQTVWNYALQTAAAIWDWLCGLAVSLWYIISDSAEKGVDRINPHPDRAAATIYLAIVLSTALTLLLSGKATYFNKLRVQRWDTKAANHVWYLTLAIFLFNGIVNAILQTDFLTTIFPQLLNRVSVFQVVYPSVFSIGVWSVNLFLMAWASFWYGQDAKRRLDRLKLNDEQINRAFGAYFGPIYGFVISEDAFSMHWDKYGANNLIANLVKVLHGHGQLIVIVVLASALIISIAYLCREAIKEWIPIAVRGVFVSVVFLTMGSVVAVAFFGAGANIKVVGSDQAPPTTVQQDGIEQLQGQVTKLQEHENELNSVIAGLKEKLIEQAAQIGTTPARDVTPTQTVEQRSPPVPDAPQGIPPVPSPPPTQNPTVVQSPPPAPSAASARSRPSEQVSALTRRVALARGAEAKPLNAGGGSFGYNETLSSH